MVLTADATPNAKRQALSLGANDFLTKPFEAFEVGLRVKNLLRMRSLYTNLSDEKSTLEEKVEERTEAIKKTQLEIVERLGLATEFRDDDTKEHVTRVGELAGKIAAMLGLPAEFVSTIRYSALLHDVGKIGISDTILLKPGKLTDEEYETMKQHTKIGAQILSGSKSEILAMAEEIAITHHERWDGRGYPNRIAGSDIPLSGRIVAVVDVYDALTNERSYKKAWPVQDALAEKLNATQALNSIRWSSMLCFSSSPGISDKIRLKRPRKSTFAGESSSTRPATNQAPYGTQIFLTWVALRRNS